MFIIILNTFNIRQEKMNKLYTQASMRLFLYNVKFNSQNQMT